METFAFHGGIMISSSIVLTLLDRIWYQSRFFKRAKNGQAFSGIRQEFRLSLIPLTLFYSSLTKLFLLFLLTIWRPSPSSPAPLYASHIWSQTLGTEYIDTVLRSIDIDKVDREWVIRNVLGGMAAGFGLRVVLDCHPVLTSIIILGGWAMKTLVASLVSSWVGGDEEMGEAWLAYSIP
jgi:hypothetical protein